MSRSLPLFLCFVLSGCDERPDIRGLDEYEENSFELIERAANFSHLFANVPFEDGKIPIVDVKNSNDGRRFGIQDRAGNESSSNKPESVLVRLERRQLTNAERQGLDQGQRSQAKQQAKVESSVRVALANNSLVQVLIRLNEGDRIDIKNMLNREVAHGRISSWDEYYQKRDEFKQLDREDVSAAVRLVAAECAGLGVEITYECTGMYCLIAEVDQTALAKLETIANVKKVGLLGLNHTNQVVDGEDVLKALQLEQFLPNNGGSVTKRGQQVHDGENFPSTKDYVDIRLAFIDIGFPNDEHPGFKEGTGSSTRIEERWDCNTNPCGLWSNAPGSWETTHATEVLGNAIGDVRDEQQGAPGVPNGLVAEQQRSGYAGEAKAHVYRAGTLETGTIRALDKIVSRTGTQPSIVLSSIGGDFDPTCLGGGPYDESANDLFEDDKLFVMAAGNGDGDPNGSATNCNVDQPAAAAATFTVGARGSGSELSTPAGVRQANINSQSAWGGNGNEGQNRSIIDLAAFGCRRYLYDLSNGYGNSECGTSYAAPTVAAGLIDFVDFYINQGWTDIRVEPGWVFANGLLAGDRRVSTTSHLTLGFDRRWGAGAVEFRRFDSSGMDSPWGYVSGAVCVDHNDVVTLNVNGGNTLSSDIEDLKFVAWWYDDRHEDSGVYDDVDVRLRDATTLGVLRSDYNNPDSKARVSYPAIGGRKVKIELIGDDISNDTSSNCGTNSIRVYYAYFYEDDDRDDGDGPAYSEIQPEGAL